MNDTTEAKITFEDPEASYGWNKDKLTWKTILLEHLRNVTKISIQEWHGGYYEEQSLIHNGVVITNKKYVQDTRMAFTNGTNSLADLLYPHFDKKAKQDFDQAEQAYAAVNKDQDADTIRNEKVIIARKLYRNMSRFLKRRNYMESRRTSETPTEEDEPDGKQ